MKFWSYKAQKKFFPWQRVIKFLNYVYILNVCIWDWPFRNIFNYCLFKVSGFLLNSFGKHGKINVSKFLLSVFLYWTLISFRTNYWPTLSCIWHSMIEPLIHPLTQSLIFNLPHSFSYSLSFVHCHSYPFGHSLCPHLHYQPPSITDSLILYHTITVTYVWLVGRLSQSV